MKVAVIGAGGWGTAVAMLLVENGHDVTMWGHDAANIERMQRTGENKKYLNDVALPSNLALTTDRLAAVSGARVVVSAIPTRWLRQTLLAFKGLVAKRAPLVSLTKGIEEGTLLRPCQVIRATMPGHATAVLSGPSHAEEVARRVPSSVVVATGSRDLGRRMQRLFTTERFRVYANSDPVGVELGGALKNVIAIAAGVCDGLGFGDNTKSALITRGLVEISRLSTRLGARKRTFAGLAGMGDLITTAFSPHGRNRAVGERIGKGQTMERIFRDTAKVAEGVGTTRGAIELANKHKIEMPIAREVHDMLFAGKDANEALNNLMTRSSKTETW